MSILENWLSVIVICDVIPGFMVYYDENVAPAVRVPGETGDLAYCDPTREYPFFLPFFFFSAAACRFFSAFL